MSEPLNLLETDLRLPGLAPQLGEALARSADPEGAGVLAGEVLRAVRAAGGAGEGLAQLWQERPAEVCRILAALGGAAPFLARVLAQHPAWLAELSRDDLTKGRAATDYPELLAAWLLRPENKDGGLHSFKYYELARITVRDLAVVAHEQTGQILNELSWLADAILEAGLSQVQRELSKAAGPPVWKDAKGRDLPLSFCVLGLGKLGSEELNYSSDVDLVYVYQAPRGELSGGPKSNSTELSPPEYFARLTQKFGGVMAQRTTDGFLYRVDLDLRPEGSRGPLVVSSDALVTYYEAWAATWEKAAFMKARPVAGNRDFGWHVIRSLDPILYRATMDFAGVAAIKEMKERVAQEKGRKAERFNVKLGEGGIRDVEFVGQCLQLLHGGRIPQVRARSAQAALEELGEVGVLPKEESRSLLKAYRFLRRVENRIQMVREQQIYEVPPPGPEYVRLSRAMGFFEDDPVAAFDRVLGDTRARVRKSFEALFHEEGAETILSLFQQMAGHLLASPANRDMIEDLAAHFAREVEHSSDPERALNNLRRFIEGVGSRVFYYGLLLDRPELVERLTKLFASSNYLSSYFASHPRLIEPIFSDPNVLLLSRAELEANLEQDRKEAGLEKDPTNVEAALDALRQFRNREILNVGLLDLDEKVTLEAAEASLTEIAEVCIGGGLRLAAEQLATSGKPLSKKGQFLVVGLGKLGGGELSYGSDLDLIFLFDAKGEKEMLDAQEAYVRLAQRFISALQTRTAQGSCYEIDARLRPSGSQGMLVASMASFERYHQKSAAVWERQALLRARPVAGDEGLSRRFEEIRREILLRELPGDAAGEIRHIRRRMEKELARETLVRRDLKAGRGGLLDVETLVQYLQLRHGRAHPVLLVPAPAGHTLDRLHELGILSKQDYGPLRRGWDFLKRLSGRLRIVEDRSISDLDEHRTDLDALARRLGFDAGQRDATARRKLLDEYRRHTEAIRQVYEKVVESE